MDINRIKKIIQYGKLHKAVMEEKIRQFYSFAGMDSRKEVLNIMQIARSTLQKKGYQVIELPLADAEIGAACYKGDVLGYVVINTSLPKVNVNFAICHEVYHVLFQECEFKSKVEFANEKYYEHEEEFAANMFAGMLLMPEDSFRFMYYKFKAEEKRSELDIIIQLMHYFQVPYMAALIRYYELELSEENCISEEMLKVGIDVIKSKFSKMWLDYSILSASKKDDYDHILELVTIEGMALEKNYGMPKSTIDRLLAYMKVLHGFIKEE